MEQQVKRFKFTKESAIADIASSIDQIANSVQSIGETYKDILGINATVVTYLRNTEKREKAVNQITENVETPIKEKL
ncbi:hypothetical protein PUN28_014771 [Cardiocondyla obscurior]|uniref:Uncharacterized protein n=1 Tax=Cardiocondyla obscurior TaxID=286306 RepID=A0AAW2EYF4_9HYME